MSTEIEKYPDKAALVTAVGDRLIAAITDAVAARDRALIVLTGGGTGIGLLEHVRENGDAIDWSKVHLFWGDERYVPEDDDERNEKQAREALLDHIDIPAANVHAMPASDGEFGDDLDAAALAYEQVLAANADDGAPAPDFDVHLLGMGGEGHINSLFPHTPAVRETSRHGGRRDRLPQAAAASNHLDTARRSAVAGGLAGGGRRREGRCGGRGGRRRRSGRCARRGAKGREATVWLLDEEAASKL